MKKGFVKKILATVLTSAMLLSMAACGGTPSSGSSAQGSTPTGSNKITFMIWDTGQKAGMQAMADGYTAKHPNVKIDIQVVNWDEYWTKLEAAANTGTLPEVFWMHTNSFAKYASAGKLADLSNLYDSSYLSKNFPQSLVNLATYDGKLYGMPKDYDTIALAYNKELFDKAKVSYPDETWTWDTVAQASDKIYKATGVFGFAAPLEDQCGYYPYIYQAGGYLLSKDGKSAGFTNAGTKLGLEAWIGYQKQASVPKQAQISEADGQTRFMNGQLGMLAWGSWVLSSWHKDYPKMSGKWDVAVLPKCPNPVSGDGRASIVNGLSFATGAENQNNQTVMDFLKYLGSEEAQDIEAKSGAAIPAFNGTFDKWAENYPDIHVKVFNDMLPYSIQIPSHLTKSQWEGGVKDSLLDVYNGTHTLDEVLPQLQATVDGYLQQ